jgi:hypothetical protein
MWRSTLNDPAIRGFLVLRGADTFPRLVAFAPDWGDHWAAIKMAIAVRETPYYRWDVRPNGVINLDRHDRPGHVPDALLNQFLTPVDDKMNAVESHPFVRRAMYMKQSRDTSIRFCLLGPCQVQERRPAPRWLLDPVFAFNRQPHAGREFFEAEADVPAGSAD